jgi:RES domain-containing protein
VSQYPLFDPEFLDALERHVTPEWIGFAYRVTVGTTEPLQTNTRGARWNPPDVEALYTSLIAEAALAEVEHLLSKQPVRVLVPRYVSRLSLRLSRVVDLSRTDVIEEFGWSLDDLSGEDLSLPRKIGSAIEFLGVPGLLVPSARTDTTNLVLFMKNHGATESVEILETHAVTGFESS